MRINIKIFFNCDKKKGLKENYDSWNVEKLKQAHQRFAIFYIIQYILFWDLRDV